MAKRTIQDLVDDGIANVRLQYETRRDSVKQAREDLRDHGLSVAANGLFRRFAANNRTGIGLFQGRVSLGILRPPSLDLRL